MRRGSFPSTSPAQNTKIFNYLTFELNFRPPCFPVLIKNAITINKKRKVIISGKKNLDNFLKVPYP